MLFWFLGFGIQVGLASDVIPDSTWSVQNIDEWSKSDLELVHELAVLLPSSLAKPEYEVILHHKPANQISSSVWRSDYVASLEKGGNIHLFIGGINNELER